MRRTIIARRAVVLMTLLLAAGSASPVGYEWDGTYYSDYFTTWAGWYHTYCDGTRDELGTLDGETFYSEKINCDTGALARRCMQKINGQWEIVDCPSWL